MRQRIVASLFMAAGILLVIAPIFADVVEGAEEGFGPLQIASATLGVVCVGASLALFLKVGPDALRRSMADVTINLGLVAGAVGMAVLIIDALAWALLPSLPQPIALPPSTIVEVETVEFSYRAETNSWGFRGDEFKLSDASGECRVVAIGDSFTYGWGVNQDETWPGLLESILDERGVDVDVLNLGKPNAGPSSYVEIAQRSTVLEPDVVIVAILQYDDLLQASLSQGLGLDPALLPFLFPKTRNLIDAVQTQTFTNDSLRQQWKEQVQGFLADASAEQLARFEALDGEVRELYISGNLNPGLLNASVTEEPGLIRGLLNLDDGQTQSLISDMGASLSEIKRMYGDTPVLVASVPDRSSLAETQAAVRRLGFDVPAEFATSPVADEAIERAAVSANLPFYTVLDGFRAHADVASLYYEFDGHFTPAGQRLFAELTADEIADDVSSLCAQRDGG